VLLQKAGKRDCNYPAYSEETVLLRQGYRRIAGVDEAGRGALAGPVVAAAVVLPPLMDIKRFSMVRDSKLLNERQRDEIFQLMLDSDIEIGIGIISPEIIDNINILNATRKAMKMALDRLITPPDFVLTDAVMLKYIRIPQKNIIDGDRQVLSIACASIAAKVTRDRIMLELHATYPQYGFCNHKGYGTPEHLLCLKRYGATKVHRFTFAPVRELSRII